MFFSNTNRTNLTNLVGCDMVYIRGIREIRGQLNTPVILHSICSMAFDSDCTLTGQMGCQTDFVGRKLRIYGRELWFTGSFAMR